MVTSPQSSFSFISWEFQRSSHSLGQAWPLGDLARALSLPQTEERRVMGTDGSKVAERCPVTTSQKPRGEASLCSSSASRMPGEALKSLLAAALLLREVLSAASGDGCNVKMACFLLKNNIPVYRNRQGPTDKNKRMRVSQSRENKIMPREHRHACSNNK